MGQTARTTKLPLDLGDRKTGGANQEKRKALEETVQILDAARRFYLAFFLAHPDKLQERVQNERPGVAWAGLDLHGSGRKLG